MGCASLRTTVALAGLSAVVSAAPLRICYGNPATPVASGEVWLVANRWGAYPGLRVAIIHTGRLEVRRDLVWPQYWNQAFDYRLVVAISQSYVAPGTAVETDFGYIAPGVNGRPTYLERFSTVYLSTPLPADRHGLDWQTALEQVAPKSAGILVLPEPRRRTIRLRYPGGRPLRNATIPISLFASRWNHCGGAVGVPLGKFATDADGTISLLSTPGSLALTHQRWIQRGDGPAGAAFEMDTAVVTGPGDDLTVTEFWSLPEYDYSIAFRQPDGKPIQGVHLEACLWRLPCGAGCGGLPRRTELASDNSGHLSFREEDLRAMGTITIHRGTNQRPLSAGELTTLLTTHRLTVTWQ